MLSAIIFASSCISLKCFWLIIHRQYPEGSFWSLNALCLSPTSRFSGRSLCALCSEQALDCSPFLSLLTLLSLPDMDCDLCPCRSVHTCTLAHKVTLRNSSFPQKVKCGLLHESFPLCMHYSLYLFYIHSIWQVNSLPLCGTHLPTLRLTDGLPDSFCAHCSVWH